MEEVLVEEVLVGVVLQLRGAELPLPTATAVTGRVFRGDAVSFLSTLVGQELESTHDPMGAGDRLGCGSWDDGSKLNLLWS